MLLYCFIVNPFPIIFTCLKNAQFTKIFKGNKDAIESLQSAVAKLAKSGETQVSALTAQLIYMQRLSIVSKKILELGLLGIHATRTVISKLEEKLKDPNANLTEIEKHEFNRLLIQLKQNEDISSRLDKQKEGLINHDRILVDHAKKIESLIARMERLKINSNSLLILFFCCSSCNKQNNNNNCCLF